jgi:two-component system alkaline phosphatase synthesis response regulator PhoP
MSTTGNEVNKGTILVIEDETVFKMVYEDALTDYGYKALMAEDAESGLQMAKTEKPDLIMLDLKLPRIQGLEVLKNIRCDDELKDIPVIILAILGQWEDISKGLHLGANDYLLKGFYSPREVMKKIDIILEQAEIRKAVSPCRVLVKEEKVDATKLAHSIGLTGPFSCPDCSEELVMELVPDYARTEGHWFVAHFVCAKCQRSF